MIRKCRMDELEKVLDIYEYARGFMKKTNNPDQWGDTWPPVDMVIEDIEKERLFVFDNGSEIYACFAYIVGDDYTYHNIDGAWLNDNEYGTIHRLASNGTHNNIFNECIKYCSDNFSVRNIRIDTHNDNLIMQHLILKEGFRYTGKIITFNGTERIAYQLILNEKEN